LSSYFSFFLIFDVVTEACRLTPITSAICYVVDAFLFMPSYTLQSKWNPVYAALL